MPGAGNAVRPEALHTFPNRVVRGPRSQVGVHDTVVVVDRRGADHPVELRVVALFGSTGAPERQQELPRVRLDGGEQGC